MKKFCLHFLLTFTFAFGYFQICNGQTMPLGPYGNIPLLSSNPVATDTATLTLSQMRGMLTDTPTMDAQTLTTPTAAILCAAFPFVATSQAIGWNFDWWVKNTSLGAHTITIGGGSGVSLVGTGTAAQSFIRHFKVTFPTGCRTNAVTLISMETTAF
jgi:hypothetical protein